MQTLKGYKSGFTLLELIVAMAIIAVLMGLSLYGIQTVQKAQRDTERRAALGNINLEITGYYADNGSYPTSVSTLAGSSGFDYVCIGSSTCTIASGSSAPAGRYVKISGAARLLSTGSVSTSAGTKFCYNGTSSSYALGVNLESNGWGTNQGNSQQLGNSGTICGTGSAAGTVF